MLWTAAVVLLVLWVLGLVTSYCPDGADAADLVQGQSG